MADWREEHLVDPLDLADSLALLDDGEVYVINVCPDCRHVECVCFFEQPESWRQRKRGNV